MPDPFAQVPKVPYLQTAGFYDRIIVEQSGAASGLSLLEFILVELDGGLNDLAAPGQMAIAADVSLLVVAGGLKSGSNEIEIKQYTPYGGPYPTAKVTMDAAPPLFRIQLQTRIRLVITADQVGWHWFEIVVNDKRLTTVPLEVRMPESTLRLVAKTLAEATLPTEPDPKAL